MLISVQPLGAWVKKFIGIWSNKSLLLLVRTITRKSSEKGVTD